MANVQDMFGPRAAQYAASVVHGNQTELARLVALVEPRTTDRLLDVATGSGNVAFAFSPHVKEVVALDITLPMLDQVRQGAAERGLLNIEAQIGDALNIPSQAEAYDIVTMRLAAHHFPSLTKFVSEVHRVLKPFGKFLLVDSAVPETDEVDHEINRLETLRDPSHFRSYRYSEWRGAMEDAGFAIIHEDREDDWQSVTGPGMDYDDWVERINTPVENRDALREGFVNASAAVAEALDIQKDGERMTFKLPRITLVGVRKD